jgi:hypothetical protein
MHMLSVFARRSTLSLLLVSTVIIGTPARANFVQIFDTGVVTGTGTLSGDSAEAVFSWDAGTHQLEVALSNHATDLAGIAQSLTGVLFGVTGGTVDAQPLSTTTITHSSATDTFPNITGSATNHDGYLCSGSGGSTTCAYDSGITVSQMISTSGGWGYGTTSLISGSGLVAGAPSGSGKPLGIVNDNIDPGDGLGNNGTNGHNPWALATTFVLHVSGTPTALDLSHLTFLFGTSGDSVADGTPTPFSLVPEPGYYGALALGLSGLLLALHRRKKSIRS